MTLHPVHEIHPAGTWPSAQETDQIALDYDQRHRRRLRLVTSGGRELLLDLARATRMRDGDGLPVAGGMVRVVAAPQPIMDIHAGTADLLRIAWHLGNRHLAVQLLPGAVRIRADHVIADMVAGLGGHVHTLQAPFEPEGGAYEPAPHSHAHDHDDDHDHAHDHHHHHD